MIVNAERTQTSHDLVIEASVKTYLRRGVEAYINTSSEKNKEVDGCHPDIVAIRDNKKYVIEEVETEDSLNEPESLDKWLHYSKLADRFILIVPKGLAGTSKEMLRENKIHAHVQEYSTDSGEVIFYDSLGNKI